VGKASRGASSKISGAAAVRARPALAAARTCATCASVPGTGTAMAWP
jgi:hypothetical protein